MRSPTRYKFRHYRNDEDGLRKLIWASDGPGRSEELDVLRGSEFELEVVNSQLWTPNALADEGEVAMLEAYFGTGNGPASLFFRLWTATLDDTSTEATAGENTGTGYPGAAVEMTKDTSWTAPAHAAGTTSDTGTFTAGASDWDACTDLMLATTGTGTGGLHIAYAALSATRTLLDTDTLDVDMTVSLE